MTWFKVDDSFYDHPKVFDAPDCAVALWVRAGCWAARNLTDGKVPSKLPARLCDDPETAISELLSRGLWEDTGDGFQFRDWTDYQPSAERVRATRVARAEAGSRGGRAKASKQASSNLPDGGHGLASDERKQNSAPTRPDPSRPSSSSSANEIRDDVERLCDYLADLIEKNGSKRPTVTKAWRDAARLLMDKDGRTEEQVHKAIDWCQSDEFWRSNILSMPTLRKQYDRVRLAAQRQPSNVVDIRRSNAAQDDMFAAAYERAAARERGREAQA
jgi:hypothetical protein